MLPSLGLVDVLAFVIGAATTLHAQERPRVGGVLKVASIGEQEPDATARCRYCLR